MPPPGTGRGAPTRSVGHTHFEAAPIEVPAGGAMDPLFDGTALLTGGGALLCALAGGAGSGLRLPTRGAACVSPLPGPNKRTWPTEMRKSDPMLFHRARSR